MLYTNHVLANLGQKDCVLQEQAQAVLGGSKKDNDVRRQEILGEGAGSLAGSLCSTCSAHAADMLRDPRACDVILEVVTAGSAGETACTNMRHPASALLHMFHEYHLCHVGWTLFDLETAFAFPVEPCLSACRGFCAQQH